MTSFVKQRKHQFIVTDGRVIGQSSIHSNDTLIATNERLGIDG